MSFLLFLYLLYPPRVCDAMNSLSILYIVSKLGINLPVILFILHRQDGITVCLKILLLNRKSSMDRKLVYYDRLYYFAPNILFSFLLMLVYGLRGSIMQNYETCFSQRHGRSYVWNRQKYKVVHHTPFDSAMITGKVPEKKDILSH